MKLFTTCLLSFCAAGILSATPVTNVTADVVSAGVAIGHSQYAGPFTLKVNGVSYVALNLDEADPMLLNQNYQATETATSSSSNVVYKEEAYLTSLLFAPNANQTNIQNAAWAIENGSSHGLNSGALADYNAASTGYQSLNLSNFEVISSVDTMCNQSQVFMIDPSANAPEPASLFLMGGGLLVAGLVRRKTAKKA